MQNTQPGAHFSIYSIMILKLMEENCHENNYSKGEHLLSSLSEEEGGILRYSKHHDIGVYFLEIHQ